MTWLEWRHTRLPLLLLGMLAVALGLSYLTHVLRGTSPYAEAAQLGPWAMGGGCAFFAGLWKDREPYCFIPVLFAGRWFDWWLPLLSTLVGAYFGSRLHDNLSFLRLQPLGAGRVLAARLGAGVLALSVCVLLGAALVSGRGALPLSWWTNAQSMQHLFWAATVLAWLRGLAVLLTCACVGLTLPPAVAAVTGVVGSLAVLGFEWDPFVQHLTLRYTVPQFGKLAYADVLPQEELQRIVLSVSPHHLLYAAGPYGTHIIGAGLLVLALLLLVSVRQQGR